MVQGRKARTKSEGGLSLNRHLERRALLGAPAHGPNVRPKLEVEAVPGHTPSLDSFRRMEGAGQRVRHPIAPSPREPCIPMLLADRELSGSQRVRAEPVVVQISISFLRSTRCDRGTGRGPGTEPHRQLREAPKRNPFVTSTLLWRSSRGKQQRSD